MGSHIERAVRISVTREKDVCVEEVSPDVRKSAKLREKDRWVCGGFPQCAEVSRVRGNVKLTGGVRVNVQNGGCRET